MPEVAIQQAGVFTRAQAREAGWSDSRQRRLLRDGIWVPIVGSALRHRSHDAGSWERAWAVSLCGRIPSHGTAAALWGYHVPDGPEHGIVAHGGGPVQGMRDHRLHVADGDLARVDRLTITAERRTLVDLLCAERLLPAVDLITDALRRGLLDEADLATLVVASRGRVGGGRARKVLTSCLGRPWSVLEWRFQQLARRVSSRWRFNVEVEGVRLPGPVDALHPDARVVVELDGKRFHGPDRFQRDRTRDQRLAAAGYVTLRFTWEDVEQRPDEVLSILRRTIGTRVRRSA
ncbi:MAG TPA: type IV toxin-antitoxin system AbiEi family antitoxin domain-containing protein [Candidatus Nanopelagicales bacterium]